MRLEPLRKAIEESRRIVCLQGYGMTEDSGCSNFRNQQDAYEVEKTLGYSPEELFSATFYNTRVHQFYDYYKRYILTGIGSPGEDYEALVKLEELGKLKSIITGSIFSLPQKAGCKNVVELHGNIYQNHCPKCGKSYSMDYIRHSEHVPLCENCKVPIRPGVQLIGEMTDNRMLTAAAEAMSQADLLLVLGSSLTDPICDAYLQYFNGDKIILIKKEEHFSDMFADHVYYGRTREVLPKLLSMNA